MRYKVIGFLMRFIYIAAIVGVIVAIILGVKNPKILNYLWIIIVAILMLAFFLNFFLLPRIGGFLIKRDPKYNDLTKETNVKLKSTTNDAAANANGSDSNQINDSPKIVDEVDMKYINDLKSDLENYNEKIKFLDKTIEDLKTFSKETNDEIKKIESTGFYDDEEVIKKKVLSLSNEIKF